MTKTVIEFENELVSCDTFVVLCLTYPQQERSFSGRTQIDPRVRFRKWFTIQQRSIRRVKSSRLTMKLDTRRFDYTEAMLSVHIH